MKRVPGMIRGRTGCYRLTLDAERYASVERHGRKWVAKIRRAGTGDLIRFAGVWPTRQAAMDECRSIAP